MGDDQSTRGADNTSTSPAYPHPHPHPHPPRPSRAYSGSELMPTSGQGRDWCAIVSTFMVACTLALIGVSTLLQGDATTGLVLVFIGCSLMLLSVCAAAGKCKIDSSKARLEGFQPDQDRPPSYRVSWRRSFLRRNRRANVQVGEAELAGGEPNVSDQNENYNVVRASDTLTSRVTVVLPQDPGTGQATICEFSRHTSPCDDSSQRHTQSLSNLLDPPPYELALASMDETQRRKLKSEINLNFIHPN